MLGEPGRGGDRRLIVDQHGDAKHPAFWLRLQAQTALCQMHIESNTRNLAYVVGNSFAPPRPVA